MVSLAAPSYELQVFHRGPVPPRPLEGLCEWTNGERRVGQACGFGVFEGSYSLARSR